MNWKNCTRAFFVISLIANAVIPSGFADTREIVNNIPGYKKVDSIGGNLNSIGSDTLNNLMTLWTERFRALYPEVVIQVEGKGSGTAPPALIQGTAQLGPMSRSMKQSEIESFEKAFGYKPLEISVAVDSLAVFVHKDNPISSITLEQLDAIFSSTRKRGFPNPITSWKQLGLTGAWAEQPISVYGRNSASGTYGYFKHEVLKEGDYKNEVKEQPGSSSVVQSISVDKNAIGYSGIGYATAGVKTLAIKPEDSEDALGPTEQNIYSGDYPLTRALYIYIGRKPGESLKPLTKEFLKFVLSKEGQELVINDGYFPLTPEMAEEELKKIL